MFLQCSVFKQSSSWPTAAPEYQHTRPGPGGRIGTGSGPAWSRGPASRPEQKIRCPPGRKQHGGTPALAGASPVWRGAPGSRSGTEDPRPVSSQAHNL